MGSCKLQAGLHKKRGARSNRLRDPLSLPPPAQACVRHDDRSPQGSVPTEHSHFLWTNGGKVEIERAHDRTQVTNADHVCSHMHAKKKNTSKNSNSKTLKHSLP